jgi:hypothetical protein
MSINDKRRKNKERRENIFNSKQGNFEHRKIPDRRCDGFEISTIYLSEDAFESFTQEYLLEKRLNKDTDIFKELFKK